MNASRRDILKATAGLALAPALGACGSGPTGATAGPDPLTAHFASLGYGLLAPHELITPYAFNAGMRYDDEPLLREPGKWLRVQGCGRIEDIARRGQPGVLPYFHIQSLRNDPPAFQGELLTEVLQALILHEGLKPERIALVSTEWFAPYREHVTSLGMAASQIVERPLDQALAAGDGSGFYAPKGHPGAPAMPTASIHYTLRDDVVLAGQQYPLRGCVELAEVSLRAGPRQDVAAEEGGIGVERLQLVQGLGTPTFEDARVALLEALVDEADRRGVALPEAYSILSKA